MLEINGLRKAYAEVVALDGITLDIAPGMFGLLGPNGAGKSTLMRTIATLQTPDEGSIRLGDLDVLADPEALRCQLGYLPQDFGTYPRITCEALLDHIAVLKGINDRPARRALVDGLLEQTNLADVRKRRLSTFSGGMRQRFGIAQAMIGNPRLMIVDEPTAGLDPVEQRRFHNLLAEISEGVVVILSTHIVEDVADLCRDMAIMGDGQILASGQPQQLVAALQGRVWQCDWPAGATVPDGAQLLSTRLSAGHRYARLLADTSPPGATAVPAQLQDCYFATLQDHGLNTET